MTTPPRPGSWTVEDLFGLPDDDGNRYELVDGNLLVTPFPSTGHIAIQRRLGDLLRAAAPPHLVAEFAGYGIRIGKSLFQPDVVVVRASAVAYSVPSVDVGDVLLAVEVLSRSNPDNDRIIKHERYAAGGIPNYWIVDGKQRRITVFHLDAGRSQYTTVAQVDAGTVYRTDRPFEIALDPAEFCVTTW